MSRCEVLVVAIHGDEAEVEVPERTQACMSCKDADTCQTGLLGLRTGPRRYHLRNLINARPGDRVALDIPEGSLVRISLLAYLMPALLAIAGAAAGQMLGDEGAALAGMLFGLIFGYIMLRRSERRATNSGSLLSLHPLSTEVRVFKETS